MDFIEIIFQKLEDKTLYKNNIIKNFKLLENNLDPSKFKTLKQTLLPFLNIGNEFKIIIKNNDYDIINIHKKYEEKTFIELDSSDDECQSDDEYSIIQQAEDAFQKNNLS